MFEFLMSFNADLGHNVRMDVSCHYRDINIPGACAGVEVGYIQDRLFLVCVPSRDRVLGPGAETHFFHPREENIASVIMPPLNRPSYLAH